jgi:SAM-dependent methyltransferase
VHEILEADLSGIFEVLEPLSGAEGLDSWHILDVGCGDGAFLSACADRGIRATGIEPDHIGAEGEIRALDIARKRVPNLGLVVGVGERLPFEDASFDAATLLNVLEHVRHPRAVLSECLRVVRSGGPVLIHCPNYLLFWEPHYKLPWLPLLPKTLATGYLRALGRDPCLLDQLWYSTHGRLRTLAGTVHAEVDDLAFEDLRSRLERPGGTRRALPRVLARLWRDAPQSRGTVLAALRLYERFRDRGIVFILRRR